MTGERGPEPTELIYLPEPSLKPALVAAGLAGAIVGTYTFWPYLAIGAAVALVAIVAWIRDARREFGRLPRRQRITSAPIPPLQRPRNRRS
jgi:hypothetical protein